MGAGNPTILLVHGAWHKPEHFDPFAAKLESHGYEVSRARLPSVLYESHDQPPTNATSDIETVREAIVAITSQSKDVVIFAHSYGGIPASEAAYGLGSLQTKAEYGVSHLVFCASYIPTEGSNLVEVAGESVEDRPTWNALTADNSKCYVKPGQEIDTFYHDCDSDLAQQSKALLAPYTSIAGWLNPQKSCAWREIPSTYIYCKDDHAVKPINQERMIKNAGVFGKEGEGRLYVLDSRHCPFLSRADEVVQIMRRCCGEDV